MKCFIALAVACLLLSSGANASRPLHGRELKAAGLGPDQSLALLTGVADLVSQIADTEVATKLDSAIDEAALATFLKSVLKSAGITTPAALQALLDGQNLSSLLKGAYTDTVLKGVANALQTLTKTGSVSGALIPLVKSLETSFKQSNAVDPLTKLLDFDTIFKGLGLPIDGAALNKVVDLEKVAGLTGDLLAAIANGYIKLAASLDPTTSAAVSTAQSTSAKAGIQLPAMATDLLKVLG